MNLNAIPRPSRAIGRLVLGVVIFIVILQTAYQTSIHKKLYPGTSSESTNVFTKPNIFGGSQVSKPSHQFWHEVFVVMNVNKPDIGEDESSAIRYTDSSKDGVKTEKHLLAKAEIDPQVIAEIKNKHSKVLADLPELKADVAYKSGTSGIVFVGGGKYSWLAYLSILALRDTGCNLPIEVVIPRYKDYEAEIEFCTTVLPQHNAACVVIPDVLGPSVMLKWTKKLATYQYKSLALMVSSFQNVLLIDADNILIKSPEPLFSSSLFNEYGMITWPDYWDRVTSPVFYDIAGVEVDKLKRVRYNKMPLTNPQILKTDEEKDQVPFHDLDGAIPDSSTESGQLLINKATHSKTLLLSLYYNMYGPTVYYKLLSLGEPGEGDKDTFPAAAHVAKQSFYQVKSNIQTFGYFDSLQEFHGVSMGQKDALIDFDTYKAKVLDKSESEKGTSLEENVEYLKELIKLDFNGPVPLFTLHCNFPKLDPVNLMDKPDLYDEENKVIRYRMYSGFKYKRTITRADKDVEIEQDFELLQWQNMKEAICDKNYDFPYLESAKKEDICTLINNQVVKLMKE